jgi:hypothetical protein
VHTDVGDLLAQMGDIKWNVNQISDAWALYKQADVAYKKAVNSDPACARSRLNYGVFLRSGMVGAETWRAGQQSEGITRSVAGPDSQGHRTRPQRRQLSFAVSADAEAAGYKSQARVENLRRASGTLLSEHVTKGKHAARDLYFVYQYKLGGPMSFTLANAAIDERASVKPTVEREKNSASTGAEFPVAAKKHQWS